MELTIGIGIFTLSLSAKITTFLHGISRGFEKNGHPNGHTNRLLFSAGRSPDSYESTFGSKPKIEFCGLRVFELRQ
jgi:hypothetical protein